MSRPASVELMSDQERRANRVLADAGVWDATHLHRLVLAADPDLSISRPSVRRYLYEPPNRLDLRVIRVMATVLGYGGEIDRFTLALYGQDKGRYLQAGIFDPVLEAV